MTQEEKAMAYDEAIKRAKEINNEQKAQPFDVMLKVFPELKESEDESIRKDILVFIRHKGQHINKYKWHKWIAWLEKQNEFKNIDSDDLATLEIWENAIKENKEKWQLSDWFVEATSLLIRKVKCIENNENVNIKGSKVMLNACINVLRNVGHSHLSDWLEKQSNIDKASYEIAEKEKREFVGDGFIKCFADFQDFKEGETYWLEYISNDNYNVRSDNLLGKTYHITPYQLYTIFKKMTWLEKQAQKSFDYESANIQNKDFAPESTPRYSIGDVLCDKSCTTLNKESQPNFEIIDIRNGMYICDKCSFPISQQDEYELVAKRIEQKPAEWSEEDERKYEDIRGCIYHCCVLTEAKHLCNWLETHLSK